MVIQPSEYPTTIKFAFPNNFNLEYSTDRVQWNKIDSGQYDVAYVNLESGFCFVRGTGNVNGLRDFMIYTSDTTQYVDMYGSLNTLLNYT